jgi:hypothetical protein
VVNGFRPVDCPKILWNEKYESRHHDRTPRERSQQPAGLEEGEGKCLGIRFFPVYAKELLVGDHLARGGAVTSVRHYGNLVTYMSDRGVEREVCYKDKVHVLIN